MRNGHTEIPKGLQHEIWKHKAVNIPELKRQALMDPLTGLLNRRPFSEILTKEFEYSRRYEDPVSLVMFDIDNFKVVNDVYGHSNGDSTLKEVANAIGANIRESDFAVRWGGEEFLVLLPKTDTKGAAHKAEEIRKIIEKLAFDGDNRPKSVTVTAGVASYIPGESTIIINEDDLIRYADKALYAGKKSGRNQTRTVTEKTIKGENTPSMIVERVDNPKSYTSLTLE